jgi:uncharacterized protein with HEPN domain
MSERIPKFLIMDIIGCIHNIMEYTKEYSYDSFTKDSKTIDAVIRNIEVMGEATNRIPEHFINQHEEVPWNLIISTRNRLIHGYDSVDNKIIWDIIVFHLPSLKNTLESLLEKL